MSKEQDPVIIQSGRGIYTLNAKKATQLEFTLGNSDT